MPKVGQAPSVIPIPPLSDRERDDRLHDMEKVTKRLTSIQTKLSKLVPHLDELIAEYLQIVRDCETSSPIRAVRLSRRIRLEQSLKTVATAKWHLGQLLRDSDRSSRHIEAAQREIMEPDIPGVNRDSREMREAVRKITKKSEKSSRQTPGV